MELLKKNQFPGGHIVRLEIKVARRLKPGEGEKMKELEILYYAMEALLNRYFIEQKRAKEGSIIAKNLAEKYHAEYESLHDEIKKRELN